MIKVNFFLSDELIKGFEISGHSGSANAGEDIICASVSSAAYMTANTVTDVLFLSPEIEVEDGYMKLVLNEKMSEAQQILKGLRLHLESLAGDYPRNIKVTTSQIRRCQNA